MLLLQVLENLHEQACRKLKGHLFFLHAKQAFHAVTELRWTEGLEL
jgi:hypothetical protein